MAIKVTELVSIWVIMVFANTIIGVYQKYKNIPYIRSEVGIMPLHVVRATSADTFLCSGSGRAATFVRV